MATPFAYTPTAGRPRLDFSRAVRWLDRAGAPLLLAAVLAVMAVAAYVADPDPHAAHAPLHALQADL